MGSILGSAGCAPLEVRAVHLHHMSHSCWKCFRAWNVEERNRTDYFGILYKLYPTMVGKFERIWEYDLRDRKKPRKNTLSLPAQVRSLCFPSANLYIYSCTFIRQINPLTFQMNTVPLS
jgi:hypothetical protein